MVIGRIIEHNREEGIRPTVIKIARYAPRSLPPIGVPFYYKWLSWNNWNQSGDYSKRPDPLKIVWISPDWIVHNSKRRFSYWVDMYRNIGLIAGGDWDQSDQKFCEATIYDSETPDVTIYSGLKSHFDDEIPWEETIFVQTLLDQLEEEQGVWHGCESEQDIFDRCVKLDELYSRIKNDGYKSRRELLQDSNDHMRRIPKFNPMRFYYVYDEVVCNIGRNGEFLFVGGHHRLSIAKLLELDRIPIRIFVRHKEWQKKIDKFDETGKYEQSCHPDIENL